MLLAPQKDLRSRKAPLEKSASGKRYISNSKSVPRPKHSSSHWTTIFGVLLEKNDTRVYDFFKTHWRALFLSAGMISSSTFLYFFFEMPVEKVLFRMSLLVVILAVLYNYRRIPWLAQRVDDYAEAKRMEKYHWTHDKDLQLVKKGRYVLWLMFFVLLGIGLHKLETTDPQYIYESLQAGLKAHEFYSDAYVYIKLAFAVFILDSALLLVFNIHIAVCRNPVTPQWVYKVCMDCARFGIGAGAAYTFVEVAADRMIHSEVSHTANRFNSWSPTGRGYDTAASKELDRSLHSVKGYNSWDHVKQVENTWPKYRQINEDSIRDWCKSNDTEVKKRLNYAQRLRVNAPTK